MATFKKQRAAELLQAFLAQEIRRLDDAVLQWVTITAVDMSPDLRNAKVFWSTLATSGAGAGVVPEFPDASRTKQVEQALAAQVHHLKRRIAEELGLRYVPQLHFRYDESAETASRIEDLIRKAGSSGTP